MPSSPDARLSLGLLVVSLGAIAAFLRLGFGPLPSRPVVRGPSLLPGQQHDPGTRFVDVSADVGFAEFRHDERARPSSPATLGPGLGLLDLDLDRDLDLVVLAGDGAPVGIRVFLNRLREKGRLAFEDVTDRCGIRWQGAAQGICAGDVDQDGDVDLFITAVGPNLLLRNLLLDGASTELRFADATRVAGVAGTRYRIEEQEDGKATVVAGTAENPEHDVPEYSTGASFGDIDADGDLDLYVANYASFHPALRTGEDSAGLGDREAIDRAAPPQPDALYINVGGGSFAAVPPPVVGPASPARRGIGVLFLQLDDAHPELLITNEGEPSTFFANVPPAPGTTPRRLFESASELGLAIPAGAGLAIGDVDADGDVDLALAHLRGLRPAVLARQDSAPRSSRPTPWFQELAGLADQTDTDRGLFGRGVVLFDYDDDGALDLAVANSDRTGDPATDRQPLQLFRNTGSASYSADLAPAAGLTERYAARGLVCGDLDDDGDLDLVLSEYCGPVRVFENRLPERPGRGSARLRFDQPMRPGVGARGDAVGARVQVQAGRLTSMAEVVSGGSYLSQGPLEFHFGLEGHERIDRVQVLFPWPGVDPLELGPMPLSEFRRLEISQLEVR